MEKGLCLKHSLKNSAASQSRQHWPRQTPELVWQEATPLFSEDGTCRAFAKEGCQKVTHSCLPLYPPWPLFLGVFVGQSPESTCEICPFCWPLQWPSYRARPHDSPNLVPSLPTWQPKPDPSRSCRAPPPPSLALEKQG